MSIKQDIYKTLIQSGMTQAGALAMMGNMKCESGLEANRVQGDFSSFRTVSKTYVARVTSGEISRDAFAKDGLGFGLFQHTFYSRKYDLYDWWKASGKALDDPVMQCEFAVAELKKSYRNLWDLLCTSNDLYICTKEICVVYERPAHNNIEQRFTAAVSYKNDLTFAPVVEPSKDIYWPPRMLCKGMTGDDVAVLQALLIAHGYPCESISGQYDVSTRNMVIAFQSQNQLDQDGIAGPLTFGKLFERG